MQCAVDIRGVPVALRLGQMLAIAESLPDQAFVLRNGARPICLACTYASQAGFGDC